MGTSGQFGLFVVAAAIAALQAGGALAGSRGWINNAIESQKAATPATVAKPAVKSPAQGANNGGGGEEKQAVKTGGGGYQISSATGGGGMDETALLGNPAGGGQSVEARTNAAR